MNAHHRDILRLALPSIVSNITVPLLGLADVTIVGHVGNARYIGAIAVGSMIFNVVYWLFGFLRMGTSGLTAQALGGGLSGQTWAVLRRSLTVALACGAAIVLLQWPLRGLAFWLMDATPDVERLAIPYYNICVWGAPAVLGLYALTGWFVGMQDTRTPMVVAIGQNLLNISASVVLVFGLRLGITGVALGTCLAQWAGLLLAVVLLRRRHGPFWQHLRQGGAASAGGGAAAGEAGGGYARFFRLNRDIFLRTLCLVAVNLYFTSAGAAQGAMTLAVNTLMMQLYLLFSYFLDGFAYAGEALSGRYYGAGDMVSLRQVVCALFGWGLLMVVVFTALYAFGGTAFLSLLTSDAAVVGAAGRYYAWAVLVPVCGVAAFVWDGVFIGLTQTRGMLLACFVAAVVFFGVWLGLRSTLGNHALWLALNAYLFVRGAVQTAVFARRYSNSSFSTSTERSCGKSGRCSR